MFIATLTDWGNCQAGRQRELWQSSRSTSLKDLLSSRQAFVTTELIAAIRLQGRSCWSRTRPLVGMRCKRTVLWHAPLRGCLLSASSVVDLFKTLPCPSHGWEGFRKITPVRSRLRGEGVSGSAAPRVRPSAAPRGPTVRRATWAGRPRCPRGRRAGPSGRP